MLFEKIEIVKFLKRRSIMDDEEKIMSKETQGILLGKCPLCNKPMERLEEGFDHELCGTKIFYCKEEDVVLLFTDQYHNTPIRKQAYNDVCKDCVRIYEGGFWETTTVTLFQENGERLGNYKLECKNHGMFIFSYRLSSCKLIKLGG